MKANLRRPRYTTSPLLLAPRYEVRCVIPRRPPWGPQVLEGGDRCRGDVDLAPRKLAAGFFQLVTRIIVPAGGGEVSR